LGQARYGQIFEKAVRIMKILCISDHIDPLVYSNSIKERFKDIDLVLCAGDLPMDYLEFIVSSLNKSLLFVFGNHNLTELHRYKNSNTIISHKWSELEAAYGSGAVHIGSKIKKEEGLLIAGLGGSMRYNLGENQYTEFQMKLEILKLIPALIFNRIFRGRFLDILLTHASPRGIHDKADPCHRGFKSFLWFMRVFKPKYLIHGHIHLYDLSDLRATRYQDTLVVNAFSHYIIETEERT
jgi:Icc-related predicted phosphoesterase